MGFDSEIEPGSSGEATLKQGHSCCGFCCDMRRAVIIVNLLNILSTIITLGLVAAANKEVNDNGTEEEKNELNEMEDALRGVAWMVVIGWFLSFASLYGAFTYRIIPVGINALYMFITYLASGAIQTQAAKTHDEMNYGPGAWIINAVITGLFIYPHVMFITEVRGGILSEETYPREKQSCCCV